MKGVLPCPYCGGEIEMVRLADVKGVRTFRIQCMHCHALVAKGQGFPDEPKKDVKKRIEDYDKYIEDYYRVTPNKIRQTKAAKQRDFLAKYSSKIGE